MVLRLPLLYSIPQKKLIPHSQQTRAETYDAPLFMEFASLIVGALLGTVHAVNILTTDGQNRIFEVTLWQGR